MIFRLVDITVKNAVPEVEESSPPLTLCPDYMHIDGFVERCGGFYDCPCTLAFDEKVSGKIFRNVNVLARLLECDVVEEFSSLHVATHGRCVWC